MLNPRAVNVYGFVAIGAMTLMLVLVVAKLVPPRLYSPLFYAAAALFVVRIVLRIALARQQKKEAELSGEEKDGAAGT
jgi:Flp pilus assembly protein TadB